MSEELRPDVLAAWVLFIAVILVVLAVVIGGGFVLIRRVVDGGNKCSACRGRVPRRATRCRHCGQDLATA